MTILSAVAMGQFMMQGSAICSVFDPEGYMRTKIIPPNQLTKDAERGLEEVNKIFQEILSNEPRRDGVASVHAGSNGGSLCKTYGNGKNAIILFNPKALKDISKNYTPVQAVYLKAWLEKIHTLPDEPEKLKASIASLDNEAVLALLGLYQECAFCLGSDELYFILNHELEHQKHYDNEKRLALRIIAVATFLIFLDVYSSSMNPMVFAFLALFSFVAPGLVVGKLEKSQEASADAGSMFKDARALKGAKSYFKKMAVFELAAERYYVLSGKVFDRAVFIKREMRLFLGLGHPSYISRYSAAMGIKSGSS